MNKQGCYIRTEEINKKSSKSAKKRLKYKTILTKKFLIDSYTNKVLSPYKICKIIKCNPGTIYQYLKRYNIKIRTKEEAQLEFYKRNPSPILGTSWIMSLEGRKNVSNSKKGCTPWNIGLTKQTHLGLLKISLSKINKKRSFETKRKISLTKGGTGIPYENNKYTEEFNKKLKLKIRKRDNYTCQNCGMTEEEHIIIIKKILPIHHIDYNKDNCNENNLITLCNQCNGKANANRNYWKQYYQNKIKEITNGR